MWIHTTKELMQVKMGNVKEEWKRRMEPVWCKSHLRSSFTKAITHSSMPSNIFSICFLLCQAGGVLFSKLTFDLQLACWSACVTVLLRYPWCMYVNGCSNHGFYRILWYFSSWREAVWGKWGNRTFGNLPSLSIAQVLMVPGSFSHDIGNTLEGSRTYYRARQHSTYMSRRSQDD